MSTSAKIDNFTEKKLNPDINDIPAEFRHLIPKVAVRTECSLELLNVSQAFGNAIRRILCSEMKTKCLLFEMDNMTSDDKFILPDFIQDRIRLIPLLQNIAADVVFSLDVVNNNLEMKTIYSSDLKITGGKKMKYFNQNIPICELNPGSFLSIKNIFVSEDYGYVHGSYCSAQAVVLLPLDEIPINCTHYRNDVPQTRKNAKFTQSGMSDPRQHLLRFETNGNIESRGLVAKAFKELRNLLQNVQKILSTDDAIVVSYINNTNTTNTSSANGDNISSLRLNGDSHTVGLLLSKTIHDAKPDIPSVNYSRDSILREITLQVRTQGDARDMINNACKYNIELINHLLKQI